MRVCFYSILFLLSCLACSKSDKKELYQLESSIIIDDLISEKEDFLQSYLKNSVDSDSINKVSDFNAEVKEFEELEGCYLADLDKLPEKLEKGNSLSLKSFMGCKLNSQDLINDVKNVKLIKEKQGHFDWIFEFLVGLVLEFIFVGLIVILFGFIVISDKPFELFKALYGNWLVIIVFTILLFVARPLYRMGVITDSIDEEIENIVNDNVEETRSSLEMICKQNLKILEDETN